MDGGIVGWGLSEFIGILVPPNWLQELLLAVVLITTLLVSLDIIRIALRYAQKHAETGWREVNTSGEPPGDLEPDASVDVDENIPPRNIPKLPIEFRKKFKIRISYERTENPPQRDYLLPPLDVLINEQIVRPDERNINITAGIILV